MIPKLVQKIVAPQAVKKLPEGRIGFKYIKQKTLETSNNKLFSLNNFLKALKNVIIKNIKKHKYPNNPVSAKISKLT